VLRPPDPNDPNQGFRSELPPLARERRPVGWRAGLQLEERFLGLLVALLGMGGLTVAYLITTGVLPAGIPPPPPPPGVLIQPPMPSVANCIVPLMALGSIGLIVVGLRRVVDP
jgi:hypothetical protein